MSAHRQRKEKLIVNVLNKTWTIEYFTDFDNERKLMLSRIKFHILLVQPSTQTHQTPMVENHIIRRHSARQLNTNCNSSGNSKTGQRGFENTSLCLALHFKNCWNVVFTLWKTLELRWETEERGYKKIPGEALKFNKTVFLWWEEVVQITAPC